MKRTKQDKIDDSVYDKLEMPKQDKATYLGFNPKGRHWIFEMFEKYKNNE